MTVVKPWVFATKPVPECVTCSNRLFSCQHPHITNLSTIRNNHSNILIGSSTLHNIWRSKYFIRKVDNFHYDTIIGGKIHDSHYSYLVNTEHWSGDANIVIAVGNNNADSAYGDSYSSIVAQLQSFVCSLLRQNPRHKVVIASLLYAPKYCDHSLPRHRNMLDKVRRVNRWISKFNKKQTGLQFDIGQYGVDGDPMAGDMIEYRYDDWKEPSTSHKLHLIPSVKDEIAKDLVKLYRSMEDL